jgi:hypothetical protein
MQGRSQSASATTPASSVAIAQDMRLPRKRSQELRDYAAGGTRAAGFGVVLRLLLK